MSSEKLLHEGLEELGITVNENQLMDYLGLLEKWNRAYNLTAIRERDTMITHHLLDSLAIAPWVHGERIIDVGTGAGFPGIPLAIAHPEWQITLLDSNGKKTRFLQEVKRSLRLENIDIIQTRVETYLPSPGFDTVTSRAFSALSQMLSWTKHLLNHQGKWLAMKGRYPEEELHTLHQPFQVEHYSVPHLDGERCCIIIDNVTEE